MGFAKYQDDIVNRHVNDNRDQQKVQARSVQKTIKKINPIGPFKHSHKHLH